MKDAKDGCMMCEKRGMHGGMCGQHHWMHIIIKIFVALFIFWCGVQFGELKSAIRNAYYGSGYGMMSGWSGGRTGNYYYGTPAMMQSFTSSAIPVPVPSATATTKAK